MNVGAALECEKKVAHRRYDAGFQSSGHTWYGGVREELMPRTWKDCVIQAYELTLSFLYTHRLWVSSMLVAPDAPDA